MSLNIKILYLVVVLRGLSYIGCLKSLEERGIIEGITTFGCLTTGSAFQT